MRVCVRACVVRACACGAYACVYAFMYINIYSKRVIKVNS